MTNEEAIKKMQAVKAYMISGNPIWSVTEMGEAFDMAIEALSAQRKGKWDCENMPWGEQFAWMGYTRWSCSCCGFKCGYELEIKSRTNYCPNCGARMVNEDADSD